MNNAMKRSLKITKTKPSATVQKKRATLTSVPQVDNNSSTESIVMASGKSNKKITSLSSFLSSGGKKSNGQFQSPSHLGQWTIRSYIPDLDDAETRKRIFDLSKKYFDDNRQSPVLICGKDGIEPSTNVFWPVCRLNNTFITDEPAQRRHTGPPPQYDGKFLAAYFTNPINPGTEDNVAFYLYKDSSKPGSFVELTKSVVGEIITKGEEFLTYLRSIEKMMIPVGGTLPTEGFPPLHILQETERERIIMQIEQPDVARLGKQNRITTTISIRYMRLSSGQNGKPPAWYHDSVGVTLSASNFFFMLEAALKNYMFRIEHLMRNFGDNYNAAQEKMSIYSDEHLEEWNNVDIADSDFDGIMSADIEDTLHEFVQKN